MSRGKDIDAAILERGLRELCADLHFDAGTKHNAWHPYQSTRQGVFHHGRHVCSMDRGPVPEFKQWGVVTKLVEVGWEEADKEDVSITTRVIHTTEHDYVEAAIHVMNQDLGWEVRPDGAVIKYTPIAYRKVRGKVVQVGWRHTLERLLHEKIPGITRDALSKKFEVDMLKFPVGSPQELVAELVEE